MNQSHLCVRTREGQRGQAAVFSALGLFTMVLFLALAVNSGILVNDRIRMQTSADLSAVAGANVQAAGMNKMADLNNEIYRQVQNLRAVLNYGPSYIVSDNPDESPVFYWSQPKCSCLDYSPDANEVINVYQRRFDSIYQQIVYYNNTVPALADKAARYTAGRNFLDPPQGDEDGDNYLPSPPTGSFYNFSDNPSSPTNDNKLVDLERVTGTMVGYNFLRSCRCCDGCCDYPQQYTQAVDSWVYKLDTGMVYYPVKLKGVPMKNFLDIATRGGSYFGADASSSSASDMLYGYAAAKPYEGNIGTQNPDNNNEGGSYVPQNPIYPPSDDLQTVDGSVNYFRPRYRARVLGIHENTGSSSAPASMADLVRTDDHDPQFKDKANYFAH